MLDVRVDELRAIVTALHQEMRRLIGSLSDADLEKRTEIAWRVRAGASHIVQAPAGDVYVARRLAAGKSATLPASSRLSIRRAVEAEPQSASGL